VGIDVSDAESMKSVLRDEMENFRIRGDGRLWQILQRPENNVPLPQIAQSQLTDYEGMTEDLTVVEQVAQRLVRGAEVVNPDRSVDEDHAGLRRRRAGSARLDSLPPKRANRRALSRSIKALSASRTSADFSRRPVKACAFADKSSSSASVVRIKPPPPDAQNGIV
jgi:hypothetical protein